MREATTAAMVKFLTGENLPYIWRTGDSSLRQWEAIRGKEMCRDDAEFRDTRRRQFIFPSLMGPIG